jgi:hypothetical protein
VTDGWSQKESSIKHLISSFSDCLKTGSLLSDLQQALDDSTQSQVSHQTKALSDVEMTTITAVQETTPWTMCELASLTFMMYNMGEGDYKSIVLEDPTV